MNDRQRRWTRYLLGIWLTLLVFSTIADIVTEPSLWNWTKLAVLAIAAPWLWHRHGRAWLMPEKIGPEAVPAGDVEAVVAESGRTVHAIKALREMHPGLGLLDAKNLVQPDH
ncbi:hypothetical protein CH272_17095 [Rhodococcus sp. 05-340-1]|jgi:ribosomal protein L7/L12|uniref:hypothetical protein n=1 Tax=unclassified Rhodococcus (in: high G+C Gram-positive bacteria) TaxID=192944 RepID=UPI000B9A2271|nr:MULTISPECIES: hypothetical protein [unclassified Rhodococcus (in: high G+C Gram-positive bacteria)]OZD63446.1 hypothetical protein CH271_22705 [Rhodococcus sp. 05-340-2]OZD75486.1 hypothetical protein CH272_17095 [Rhodococcus sp. 05-340-1]OZF36412.1 hypothetical protein CH295_08895 [Rhodococcus sp. 14-2483-1-2]